MILREGHAPILVIGVAGAVITGAASPLAAIPAWLLLLWLLVIYWERRPPVPANPRGVLSPVSGRVTYIGEEPDPYLEREALRIRVDLRFPGIVPVRSPTEGKVMDLYARRGVFGEDQRPCTEDESPDCYGQWIRTDEDEDIVFVLSSRAPVSRARFDQAPGERVGQGSRTGFFYLASFADVLVPAPSTVEVTVGDRVDAGESVLAQLARS